MQPVKASYTENADYYAAMAEQSVDPRTSIYVVAGLIAAAIIGGISHLQHDAHWYWWSLFAFLVGVGLGNKSFRRWQHRRQYRQHFERQNVRIEWEFAEDNICCVAGNDVASRYSWDWPKRIVQRPGGFVIYVSATAFQWLPREAFATAEDFQRVAELMKSKVAAFEVKAKG